MDNSNLFWHFESNDGKFQSFNVNSVKVSYRIENLVEIIKKFHTNVVHTSILIDTTHYVLEADVLGYETIRQDLIYKEITLALFELCENSTSEYGFLSNVRARLRKIFASTVTKDRKPNSIYHYCYINSKEQKNLDKITYDVHALYELICE